MTKKSRAPELFSAGSGLGAERNCCTHDGKVDEQAAGVTFPIDRLCDARKQAQLLDFWPQHGPILLCEGDKILPVSSHRLQDVCDKLQLFSFWLQHTSAYAYVRAMHILYCPYFL